MRCSCQPILNSCKTLKKIFDNPINCFLFCLLQQEQNQQNSDAGTEESDDTFPFSGFFRGMVRTNPELAGVLSACEKYIPFVLILIIKQLYDHSTGTYLDNVDH